MFEQHTDPYLGEVSRNFGLVLKEWRVMGTITRRPAKFSDLSWWAGLWSPVAVKRVKVSILPAPQNYNILLIIYNSYVVPYPLKDTFRTVKGVNVKVE